MERYADRPTTQRRNLKGGLSVACVIVAVWVAMAGSVLSGTASTRTPGVLPPQSNPFGAGYSTWATRSWLWELDQHTAPDSPFQEQNAGTAAQPQAVDCSVNQSGHVWFLIGTDFLQSYSTAYRSCAIPSGTALFIPILDYWIDNLSCPGQEASTFTAQQLQDTAKSAIDAATSGSISLQVDGADVAGLGDSTTTAYRAPSGPFFYSLPADSPLDAAFCPGNPWPAGTMPPPPGAYADGVYVMLAPLATGVHHISLTAQVGSVFSDETHYTLTVGPSAEAAQG